MTVTFADGDILDGKYRVEGVLGQGAMGIVLGATRIDPRGGDDAHVAVKVLLHDHNPELVTRFRREGKAALQLESEHVARVFDVGTLASGAPYLVMERLDGEDLQAKLRREGRLSIQEAVYRVLEACAAMAEAHGVGIVHRDLKPSNMFLARVAGHAQPVLKVLDFGVSKQVDALGEPEEQLTRTQAMLGSPLYMSIEQMRSSRRVDARADVWSLGAILYQLVTGRTPFQAENLPELMLKVGLEEPPRPSSVLAGLPPALDAAILKCLEKKVDARTASVADLAEAIAPFGPPEGVALARRARSLVAAAPPPTSAAGDEAELTNPDDDTFEAATIAIEPPPEVAAVSGPLPHSYATPLSTPRPYATSAPPPSSVAAPQSRTTQQPSRGGARAFVAVASVVALGAVGAAVALNRGAAPPEVSRPVELASAVAAPAAPVAPTPTVAEVVASAAPSASASATATAAPAVASPSASSSSSPAASPPPKAPSADPNKPPRPRQNPLEMDIQ